MTSSQAEDELNRKFNKEDFESLEVIGQFNKGFIIARLKVGYRLNILSHLWTLEAVKSKYRVSHTICVTLRISSCIYCTHDKDDLFIIDQHASDEKCNYEKFMTQDSKIDIIEINLSLDRS